MKKFLTILSILGCSLFASAQCTVMVSADSTGAGIILTANTMNNMAVSFEWNNGETTQSISADPNTFDYCVIVTYADGCIAEDCYGDYPQGTCNVYIQSVQNGQWLQAFANGEAPFNFEWSNGSTDSSIPINTNDTLHCVTMTDVTGCVATSCYDIAPACDVSISEESTPAGGTALVANATANGQVDYFWSTGETTESIIPNGTGNYCVEIYGDGGQDSCYASACYYYNDPNACYVYINADTLSYGDPDVELFTSTSGGNAPYIYEWSTGEDTEDITVTENGQYCVTITGANGCENSDCFNVNIPQCIVSISEESNPGGETILVANAEGDGAFEYYWNTGETTESIIPDGTGNYCVSLSINSGGQDSCFANACYYFADPNECFVVINQADSTQTGASEITLIAATTGNGNFTYEWNTGETTEEINVSETGNYCVTVTSSLGCVETDCYYLYNPDCFVTITEEVLPSGQVALVANTEGAVEPITYNWNNGETTQSILPSFSGYYSVIINSGNTPNDTCSAFTSYYFNNPNDCFVNINQADSTQTGASEITLIAATTGNGNFTYEWSTGETTEEINVSETGNYCVTVTSSLGCVETDCYYLYNPDCFVTITEEVLPSGEVALVANTEGAVEPITYNWNNGETTQSIIPDGSGFYWVTMNSGGSPNDTCSAFNTYYFDDPTACSVYISSSDSTQIGEPVTSLVVVTIGNGNFTYEWSTGETTQEIEVSEEGDYCVTVTSSLGCVETACYYLFIPDCYVTISEENTPDGEIILVANAVGTMPIEYLWNTGETTQSIVPNGTDYYSVTISTGNTPNDNCFGTNSYYYNDPTDCPVTIYGVDSLQTGIVPGLYALPLQVLTTGIDNFSYQWSTGDTTNIIEVSEDGTYCVTISNDEGCIGVDCIDHVYQTCGASISAIGNGNISNADLCPNNTGIAPFTYLWSTGETTECINISVSGTYGLTITDANGCVSEASQTYQFPQSIYSLEGRVYTFDSLNNDVNLEGWVYQFSMNPDGTASLIDSTEIINDSLEYAGYYDFGEVDAGTYIVKAALTEGSDGYETNLPTYHFSSLTWGEADMITIPANGFPPYNIHMIEGDNPGGPGGIYGSVIVGDGLLVDPIPNTSILLFDESENPMQHVLTDGNGEFDFPALPYGTYKVQVEIVGLAPAWYWVTIGPDNPTADGLTFEVNEFGITTDIAEVLAVETFHVFPNPVTDKLTINFNANRNSEVQISLTSITGQTITVENQQLSTGAQSIEMDVTTIPTGIYFLNITDGKDVVSKKIVKR